jgi:hypothetical protein
VSATETQAEIADSTEAMEAKETARAVPAGWWLLFFGLIAWGVYYLWAYSPWASGWTQAGALEAASAQGGNAPPPDAGLSTNVLMTILFTAIPTAAAIWLIMAQRKAKSRS